MWTPIVGKAFSTPEAFSDYVDTLKFGLWRPSFIVVHNTSVPDTPTYLGHWTRPHPVTDEQWMQNLIGEYRDKEHWSAGPHLFVTPHPSICAFSPLTGPGTHSPSWNHVSWGVETVGEFDRELFTGPIRDLLVETLAILHIKAGLSPFPYMFGVRGLHFHKEDPNTLHKDCPGRNMIKADLVAAVQARMVELNGGGHKPALPAPVAAAPIPGANIHGIGPDTAGGPNPDYKGPLRPDDLAAKLAQAMKMGNYPLATDPGEFNIIYVEGMNTDGTPNDFRPNAFDSVRVLLSTVESTPPRIVGIWDAATHAGLYWETHRMNPLGAFHIRLGQQTAWVMGQYHTQTALLQARPLEGTRDGSNDFKREGPVVRGDFGVHHHWGYNYPKDNAGKSSAGCQVGRTEDGHNQFINFLKTDPRYGKDHGFVWSSTVLTAAEVLTPAAPVA